LTVPTKPLDKRLTEKSRKHLGRKGGQTTLETEEIILQNKRDRMA
jgi:hypothetical protein